MSLIPQLSCIVVRAGLRSGVRGKSGLRTTVGEVRDLRTEWKITSELAKIQTVYISSDETVAEPSKVDSESLTVVSIAGFQFTCLLFF